MLICLDMSSGMCFREPVEPDGAVVRKNTGVPDVMPALQLVSMSESPQRPPFVGDVAEFLARMEP